ncbi:MAG: hypothetical protein H6817_11525 [Phycisphaerales bacterium]|nr:hypothetical protein [Phycisphaerales bacterium]
MAGKFVFRLEPVLRMRQRAFESHQRIVAERLRAIGREQTLMLAAREQIAEQVAIARDQRVGRIDMMDMRGSRAHLAFLNRRVAECAQRIVAHEHELEHERSDMVAARVAVRALEKLKERRAERYSQAIERREAADQAELALQMFRQGKDRLTVLD